MKKESKIKDIYDGKCMDIWEDDESVFMNIWINGVTMCLSKEDFELLKDDLETFINGEPNRRTAG